MRWRMAASLCATALGGLLALGGCNHNGDYSAPTPTPVDVVAVSNPHVQLNGKWIGCINNAPNPDVGTIWDVVGVSIIAIYANFTTNDGTCDAKDAFANYTIQWAAVLVTSNPADQTLAGWSNHSSLQPSGPPKGDLSGLQTNPPTATVFNVTVVLLQDDTNPSVAPPDNSTFQMARFIDDTVTPNLMYGDTAQPSPACDALFPDPPNPPTGTTPYVAAGGCLYNVPMMLSANP